MSNNFGPYGTCDYCGWSGNDWAFKYQGLCSKCYKLWKKKRAENRRSMKPINENMQISGGFIVTRNVQEQLMKHAQNSIPYSTTWQTWNKAEKWAFRSILIPSITALLLYIIKVPLPYQKPLFWVTCVFMGLLIYVLVNAVADRIMIIESNKRVPKVNECLEQFARERQQRIDEALEFYQSAEWRLVRNKVLRENNHICQNCGKKIKDDYDLTIDHILPRSKFPQRALDKSNLQILCRSCNSQKADNVDI